MRGKKCLRDIDRLNIIDFLSPYKRKINDVFNREGTAATRRYIYRAFNIRMKGHEIRTFLNRELDRGAFLAREAHSIAWDCAGWNGSYSALGYSPGDHKREELLSAGLLVNGEKILFVFHANKTE